MEVGSRIQRTLRKKIERISDAVDARAPEISFGRLSTAPMPIQGRCAHASHSPLGPCGLGRTIRAAASGVSNRVEHAFTRAELGYVASGRVTNSLGNSSPRFHPSSPRRQVGRGIFRRTRAPTPLRPYTVNRSCCARAREGGRRLERPARDNIEAISAGTKGLLTKPDPKLLWNPDR
jgi:hypothetical protein